MVKVAAGGDAAGAGLAEECVVGGVAVLHNDDGGRRGDEAAEGLDEADGVLGAVEVDGEEGDLAVGSGARSAEGEAARDEAAEEGAGVFLVEGHHGLAWFKAGGCRRRWDDGRRS